MQRKNHRKGALVKRKIHRKGAENAEKIKSEILVRQTPAMLSIVALFVSAPKKSPSCLASKICLSTQAVAMALVSTTRKSVWKPLPTI